MTSVHAVDRLLSGEQHRLVLGDYEAYVASIGASLRSLTFRGRDLVRPYAADETRPRYSGAVLAPWPNRVVDGRYVFDGTLQSLAISEPERGHALHGLVAWCDFEADRVESDRVELATVLRSPRGYPHELEIRVVYSLDELGLSTTVTATNLGATDAPFGVAAHPYLVAGRGRVDDWSLSLPADQVLAVSNRLVPVGLRDVADPAHGDFDFRSPRRIGAQFIDHAFTGLAFERRGLTRALLTDADGAGVSMTWTEACPWVQIHTADLLDPMQSRRGLALEPMTCPPDAFNSGKDLIRLGPAESTSAQWWIAAVGP